MGVTDLVRQALSDLGGDATTTEVRNYILERYPSLPARHIWLALSRARTGGSHQRKPCTKSPDSNPLQGTFGFVLLNDDAPRAKSE